MTDTAKHTPGPWEVRELSANPYSGNIHTADFSIADVQLWSFGDQGPNDAARANALLIAAAPELLEAMKAFFAKWPDIEEVAGESVYPEIAAMWAAIAKAQGR